MSADTRDHGGDLDRAQALFGAGDWLDLSTGINRVPYPVGNLPDNAWTALPTRAETRRLEATAASAYGTEAPLVALAGAQAAIQLVPRLMPPGRAAVLTPSYNEHAAALGAQGWEVTPAPDLRDMVGADLAVVVNPNNPDGRRWSPDALKALSEKVGLLVVDESFADAEAGLSLAPALPEMGERVVVLRSFGKFYGLAGLRLGFAAAGPETAERLRALAGPWAAGGPAIALGTQALSDQDWQAQTARRLHQDARRMTQLCAQAGWSTVGASALFVTVETGDAKTAQTALARHHIWTRAFPYNTGWLRLGLPGTEAEWARLQSALPCGGQ